MLTRNRPELFWRLQGPFVRGMKPRNSCLAVYFGGEIRNGGRGIRQHAVWFTSLMENTRNGIGKGGRYSSISNSDSYGQCCMRDWN